MKGNGEVWVMGTNKFGQAGFDRNKSKVLFDQPTFLLKDENIISICCGYYYSFILSSKKKF